MKIKKLIWVRENYLVKNTSGRVSKKPVEHTQQKLFQEPSPMGFKVVCLIDNVTRK